MRVATGPLETQEQIAQGVSDLQGDAQDLADVLTPLINAPLGVVSFLVRNADGTYGTRVVVGGAGVTFVDDPVTGTLTLTAP